MGKELIYFDVFLPHAAAPRQHRHAFHEMLFNYEPGGEQRVDARRWPMQPHELYFFPAGQNHMGNGEFHGGVIHVGTDLFSPLEVGENEAAAVLQLLCDRAAAGHFLVPLSAAGRAGARRIFLRLLDEFRQGGHGTCLAWRLLTLELLLTLLRDGPLRLSATSAALPRFSAEERIRHACLFLHENCDRKLTVGAAAQSAGMSRSHFLAMFRRVTGTTFTEYVNTQRCQRAAGLLRQGQPAAAAAAASGFASVSNFYRAFRQLTGHSPRDYRGQGP